MDTRLWCVGRDGKIDWIKGVVGPVRIVRRVRTRPPTTLEDGTEERVYVVKEWMTGAAMVWLYVDGDNPIVREAIPRAAAFALADAIAETMAEVHNARGA